MHYDWIREQFDAPADLKVFVLHHHLLPIPGTGRERSTVMDAGDLLEVLINAGVARRAVRTQARAVRLAAGEHVHRERRHGVVPARARVHQALLQRARVRRGRGQDPPRSSRSATSHVMAHFSLDGRAAPSRARSGPSRNEPSRSASSRTAAPTLTATLRRRGHPDRCGPSCSSTASTIRRSRAGRSTTARRARTRGRRRAVRRRHREARAAGPLPDLGVPHDRGRRRPRWPRSRDAIDALAPRGACSTCPTSRCSATASGWSWRRWRSPAGVPYLGADFRLDPPIEGPPLPRADARGDRDRQAHRQDRDRRRGRPPGRRAAGSIP